MQKVISIENCVEAGYVKKTHGVQGGLHLIINENLDAIIEEIEFLFFEIDGLPVPFFIETISSLGTGYANIQFMYIENKEKAQHYVGSKLLIDKQALANQAEIMTPNALIGFTIIDQKLGEIGQVTEVNDFGGNIVLSINYKKREVMIPFNEELILSFNIENTTITMDCPEGLFDLTE
ncbi:MAG: ribosome maturation factor RimM [Prolixibacteraceae bacterium]